MCWHLLRLEAGLECHEAGPGRSSESAAFLPTPVLRLTQTQEGQRQRVFAQQIDFLHSSLGPARSESKEQARFWFRFRPESAFDLRGLSLPGLFICRNHSGFLLLQIHLQETTPGGVPTEVCFTALCATGSLRPGSVTCIPSHRCDSQPWAMKQKPVILGGKTGSDKPEVTRNQQSWLSWETLSKAPPGLCFLFSVKEEPGKCVFSCLFRTGSHTRAVTEVDKDGRCLLGEAPGTALSSGDPLLHH